MRDFVADLLARLQSTNRQQRLYLLLGFVALVVLLRFGTGSFFAYREGVKADIRLTAQRLASARQLVERAPQLEQQLEQVRLRYRKTVSELIPGDTPTLAAAELQDRVSSLAAKNGVRIQTTQVLKDEAVGPFREVSLRITASGDIRNLAGLLSELEFGDLRVTIPFLELSRRGASIRRRTDSPHARAVSATFQISGIVAGTAELPGLPPLPTTEAAAPGPGSQAVAAAEPAAEPEAAPADSPPPPAPAPPVPRRPMRTVPPQPDGTLPFERQTHGRPPRGSVPAESAVGSAPSLADRPQIPDDPLGTSRRGTEP